MPFLSQLNWRFATKVFDASRPVSEQHLKQILDAIRQAPTSFGLQPFHVYVLSDLALREKMKASSYNQPQVTDASALLVFCSRNDMSDQIDRYINTASGGDAEAAKNMEGLRKMLTNSLLSRTPEDLMAWAAKQTYIALGFGLAACAELEIDSCPMEGFNAQEIDKILELPPHIHSQAYLAIGYRKEGPRYPHVRFSEDALFTKR